MATMKSRGAQKVAQLIAPALCLFGVGIADAAAATPAVADTLPAASNFAFDSAIHHFVVGDRDSFLVVANARNVSNSPISICCRFDFEGGFTPAGICPGERPPTFVKLALASIPTTGVDCRATLLAPGAAYSDSAGFQLYRSDFARCPGTVEMRGSFWVGCPGKTFAEAKLLVQDAVRVSAPEPAAP